MAAATDILNDLTLSDPALQPSSLAAFAAPTAGQPAAPSGLDSLVQAMPAPTAVEELAWSVPSHPLVSPEAPDAALDTPYLGTASGLLTAAFDHEESRLHEALLAGVTGDAALCLRLRSELRRFGDFSPLAGLDERTAHQVHAALGAYAPMAAGFFPLHVAQAQLAVALGDEAGHHLATLEGTRAMQPLMNLLATASGMPLLTVQRLAHYASPLLADLAEVRRHDLRLELLNGAVVAYQTALAADEDEAAQASAGYYSACRMAALSALHLGMYQQALNLLTALPDEPYELDVPRQVLQTVALAQLGNAREAVAVAQYVALLPEVMGPLGLDLAADVDEANTPEPLGGIDLDNPEDGYQYHHIDLRLFPDAAYLLLSVKRLLEAAGFDPNDPFTPPDHPVAQRAAALLASYRPLAFVMPGATDVLH